MKLFGAFVSSLLDEVLLGFMTSESQSGAAKAAYKKISHSFIFPPAVNIIRGSSHIVVRLTISSGNPVTLF